MQSAEMSAVFSHKITLFFQKSIDIPYLIGYNIIEIR